MAEVTTQVADGVKAPLATLKAKPVTAVVVALITVSLVVLIEIFYPGAITGRIRSVFNMAGVKGKA